MFLPIVVKSLNCVRIYFYFYFFFFIKKSPDLAAKVVLNIYFKKK